MRYSDDLSDEPGASREALVRWRAALDRALEGDCSGHPALPAFHDTVKRYRIPPEYFHQMIDGVSSDLEPRRIATFDELYGYCYQVASVVGMTTIHIFGFEDREALKLAEKCGIAFQLTNIIRDVSEDLGRGRIYLPQEDLARFGIERIEAGLKFTELMRFEGTRARSYYRESEPLLAMIHPSSRRALWALIEIYSRLLAKIEASGYDVLRRRIALSPVEKAGIVSRAVLGC
jgi:15-cis-phytoene synthase